MPEIIFDYFEQKSEWPKLFDGTDSCTTRCSKIFLLIVHFKNINKNNKFFFVKKQTIFLIRKRLILNIWILNFKPPTSNYYLLQMYEKRIKKFPQENSSYMKEKRGSDKTWYNSVTEFRDIVKIRDISKFCDAKTWQSKA